MTSPKSPAYTQVRDQHPLVLGSVTSAPEGDASPMPAPQPPGSPNAVRRPRRVASAILAHWLPLLAYFPLAAIAFLPSWEHWGSQLNGSNAWDQILLEWLIAWFPNALREGHSLFVTNYLDAPGGVNLMWNTSMPLLSLAAAPLTFFLGPVHTFTILMTSALGLSSVTMYLLLQRWVPSRIACWFGGLIYGFSSYSVAEARTGQLHLVFLALIPLMVLVLDHLVRDAKPRTVTLGCVFGLLAAAQLLISEEVLLIFAMLAGLGLAVGALIQPTHFRSRLAPLTVAAGWGFVVFGLITAYPLGVQFLGPDHITGPTQPYAQLALFSGDLTAPILPGPNQLIAPALASNIAVHFSTNINEVTEYVGVPLLIALAVWLWLRRRDPLVLVLAAIASVSFILTLGPRLIIANHHTSVVMPYAILKHLPVVGDVMPSRFAMGMWFGIAVLAAGAFSAWLDRSRRWRGTADEHAPSHRLGRVARKAGPAMAVIAGMAILVPLLPAWPYPAQPAAVPALFTTAANRVIRPGSLVLTYPYPITITAQPMLWQAVAGMRFRLLGGYVVAPDASGAGTFFADANPWEYCFLTVYLDGSAPASLCNPSALRESLGRLGVDTIVAASGASNADIAAATVTRVVGARPRLIGGVWVWSCSSSPPGARCRSG